MISAVQQAQQKQGAELVRVAEQMALLQEDVDRLRPPTPETTNAYSTPPASSRRIPPELSVCLVVITFQT